MLTVVRSRLNRISVQLLLSLTCLNTLRDQPAGAGTGPHSCAAVQIHLTQGVTPADMYISWATGDAVYTYCSESDSATCGNGTQGCECNQLPPKLASSQVKYSTDSGLADFQIAQEAGDYPVTVQPSHADARSQLLVSTCATQQRGTQFVLKWVTYRRA